MQREATSRTRVPRRRIAPVLLVAGAALSFTSPNGRGQARSQPAQECARAKPVPPPSYESFFGRQRVVSDTSPRWKIRLVRWTPWGKPEARFTFRLLNRRTHAVSHLTLDSDSSRFYAAQIDQVDLVGARRAVLLSRTTWGVSTVYLIRLPGGAIVDHFLAVRPAISPGHRYLAFVNPFPEHPGPVSVNWEYLVYDLAAKPAYNRPHFKAGVAYGAGWPVYPPGATNAPGENLVPEPGPPVHTMSSGRIFWTGGGTFALADTWQGTVSLIAVRLPRGIRHPEVSVTSLMPLGVINMEKCGSLSPAGFSVRSVAVAPGQPSAVCLWFRTQDKACLARRSAEVPLAPFQQTGRDK